MPCENYTTPHLAVARAPCSVMRPPVEPADNKNANFIMSTTAGGVLFPTAAPPKLGGVEKRSEYEAKKGVSNASIVNRPLLLDALVLPFAATFLARQHTTLPPFTSTIIDG